jgi:hypothetical protein
VSGMRSVATGNALVSELCIRVIHVYAESTVAIQSRGDRCVYWDAAYMQRSRA